KVLQGRVAEHVAKALLADLPLTDVGVAVAVRAERDHRVVDVQAAEALDADHAVELVEDAVDAAGLVHRIARGKEVLGVQAEGEAALVADAVEHGAKLLERPPDRVPGSGGVLEVDAALSRGLLQRRG